MNFWTTGMNNPKNWSNDIPSVGDSFPWYPQTHKIHVWFKNMLTFGVDGKCYIMLPYIYIWHTWILWGYNGIEWIWEFPYKWGYPHSWMVYKGKCHWNGDLGVPHNNHRKDIPHILHWWSPIDSQENVPKTSGGRDGSPDARRSAWAYNARFFLQWCFQCQKWVKQ